MSTLTINNNNGVAGAAPQLKGAPMNGASVATPNAQEQDKVVVHHGSSDQHMRVVVVDRWYVHVVSVNKNIDDWCQDIAPMYKRKDADGTEYWTKTPVTITKHYGIIKAPDGKYRERSFWSLDEFCKKFNIKHVNDLEWIYRETGVVCHNTDPRDPYCPHNNERTGYKHTSSLQYDIENGNHSYMERHAWYRRPGNVYWDVIQDDHPEFENAKKENK